MASLSVLRDGPRLIPASRFDLEELDKLPPGKLGHANVFYPRSIKHHRWYRALIGVVAEALGMSADALNAELKFKAGFVRRILTSNQFGVAVELESTAFPSNRPDGMDEARFNEFRTIAVELLFRDYLPEVNRKSVYQRVADILKEPCPW